MVIGKNNDGYVNGNGTFLDPREILPQLDKLDDKITANNEELERKMREAGVLPEVSSSDNGSVLYVNGGLWDVKNIIDPDLDTAGYAADAKATGEAIDAVKGDFSKFANDGYIAVNPTIIENSYPNASGGFDTYNNWNRTDYIEIEGGTTVYFNNTRQTTDNAFYDKNKGIVKRFTIAVGNSVGVVVPNNVCYMVVSNASTSFFKAIVIPQTKYALTGNALPSYVKSDFFIDGYITATGNVNQPNNDQKRSDYIPCAEGQKVEWLGTSFIYQGSPAMCCVAFFDFEKKFISGVQKIGDETAAKQGRIITTAPTNTAYVVGSTNGTVDGEYIKVYYSLSEVFTQADYVAEDAKRKLSNARYNKGNGGILTLLHISDIHNNRTTYNRIIEKASGVVDDMICTGDMVGETAAQISSWWNENVMTCIGNHDSAETVGGSTDWTALSMADRDAYYIAPFESNWSVTHISGTSYYYKDYPTQKVRLIVMDGMLYNDNGDEATAQNSWLSSLLSDAITNSFHVLIAIHAPHGGATPIDCSFSRYGQTTMQTLTDCNTPQAVIDAVATAISGGLHFIGYIVGHMHQDGMWDAENDGSQLMYGITCASTVFSMYKYSDQYRDENNDAYNLVTIDTYNTLVKIVRGGGADIDNHMRTRKAICFNYSTGEKVGEVL